MIITPHERDRITPYSWRHCLRGPRAA